MMKLLLLLLVLVMFNIGFANAGCDQEIAEKVKALAGDQDPKVLFYHYAPQGRMNVGQVKQLLKDADVSYWCTWPNMVLIKFDTDYDGELTWAEVNDIMNFNDVI